MKSFLASLCILLSLMGAAQPLMAKDASTSSGAGKVDTKNALVNLNKADANTLQYYLKGIGAVRSQAIIDHRTKHGAFKSVDDLLAVTGIGKATLSGIKSNLSLTRGEYTAPKVAATSGTSTKKSTTDTTKTASSTLKDSTSGQASTDTKSAKSSKDDTKADTKSAKKDGTSSAADTKDKAGKTTSKDAQAKSSTKSASTTTKKDAKTKSKSSDQSKSTKKSSSEKKKDSKKKVLPTDKKS